MEVGVEFSRLSNGSPDWRAQSFRITRKQGPRDGKEMTLTQTNRFGPDDQRISGVYSTPLSDKLTASLGANISPSHRVLAKRGIEGVLQYEFAPAWLLHGGLANTRHDKANVDHANLMAEHYFSAFSVSAAWRPVRALGVSSSSYQLRGSYYYGDANFVGVIAGSGREATSVSANSVLLADVRATALRGRHWLSGHGLLTTPSQVPGKGVFTAETTLVSVPNNFSDTCVALAFWVGITALGLTLLLLLVIVCMRTRLRKIGRKEEDFIAL